METHHNMEVRLHSQWGPKYQSLQRADDELFVSQNFAFLFKRDPVRHEYLMTSKVNVAVHVSSLIRCQDAILVSGLCCSGNGGLEAPDI
jgi:hypothetical protein